MAWHAPGRPVWPMRDPAAFAREGYGRNAIAYRCVRLIAEAAASAPLQVGPSGHGGVLASVTNEDVLNGANAFAIEADDEWEIVQAAECELVEPGVYELRTFLRGLQGSAHAMRAPHPVGARIVKLDQRLARVSVNAHEWQELLNFIEMVLPHAAKRPWAPAHLRGVREATGDVTLSWVRCAYVGGDSWGPGEPPFGSPCGKLPAGGSGRRRGDPQRNNLRLHLYIYGRRTNGGFWLFAWIVADPCRANR